VINNGIDLNIFSPKDGGIFRKKYNLKDKSIVLGVASIWDERKGFKYFLEFSKLIDINTKIVLVGLNDKQIKELPQNVIGIKRTNNIEELAEIYSAADVFVNPTLEDNFPTTNLEALACGTSVITFDTGGSSESIDESCGDVINKGDINALIELLNSKYSDREKNIAKCTMRSSIYNKDKKLREYLKVYKA